MKRFITSRKKIVALGVATATVLGGSYAAYAYFTDTGHGTGSVTVGSSSPWTVGETGTPSGGPLYPDASIGGTNVQTDTYTVKNAGSGSQNLTQVVISIGTTNKDGTEGEWSSQSDSNKPACTASDFSVGSQDVGSSWTDTSAAADFTAGQSQDETVSVEMIDSSGNQDNCQGVTVPLYFAAS